MYEKELDRLTLFHQRCQMITFWFIEIQILLHQINPSENLSNWVNFELNTTLKTIDLKSAFTIQTNFCGNALFSANTEVQIDSILFKNNKIPYRGLSLNDSEINVEIKGNIIKIKEGEYTVSSSIYIPRGYKVKLIIMLP